MEQSQWLGNTGISEIRLANGEGGHDGTVKVSTGVSLSNRGEDELQKYLTARIKGIDSIVCIGTIITIVAKAKADGTALDAAELKKLGNSAIKGIGTWSKKYATGDLTFILNQCDEQKILEAMAMPSAASTFQGNEHSEY